MAGENRANISQFLTLFLSNPSTGIPKGAQWVVMFHDLPSIMPSIMKAYQREPGNNEWRTQRAAAYLQSPDFQTKYGCFFCQAIAIPGEGMTPVVEGSIKSNSLIRSYVGQGRNDFQEMRMSFLDTNVSFTDSFLRGWSIATAAFGMIARTGQKNYRTTATCVKFGTGPSGPTILQRFDFDGLCCTAVSEEEYNYDPATNYVKREARFVYHSYSVNIDDVNELIP
jgi:hypothetical protein